MHRFPWQRATKPPEQTPVVPPTSGPIARVRFFRAKKTAPDVLLFLIEVEPSDGRASSGAFRVSECRDDFPLTQVSEEVGRCSPYVTFAGMAAVKGPFSAAVELQVGEEMETLGEAVVSEDPPSTQGFAAIRVVWAHDRQAPGIVVTVKRQS